MFDEADLYIPANAKPATAEPLQSLLKRARSAGLGLLLATQSPGDLDYKSRDQITSWFIGRVREDTALRKLKAAFQSESGLDAAAVLPGQTVGEFHLVQEGLVRVDEGAALAHRGRTGALRSHRAAGARDQRPGRAPVAPLRYHRQSRQGLIRPRFSPWRGAQTSQEKARPSLDCTATGSYPQLPLGISLS